MEWGGEGGGGACAPGIAALLGRCGRLTGPSYFRGDSATGGIEGESVECGVGSHSW
jgi:hypothetical protein